MKQNKKEKKENHKNQNERSDLKRKADNPLNKTEHKRNVPILSPEFNQNKPKN